MAARGGAAPAGEGLRYAEYSPPATKRDADVDQGLVSPAGCSRPSAGLPASTPGFP